MNVLFRDASLADVPEIVALLRDDTLGNQREGSDLSQYQEAFRRMQGEGNNTLVVGELAGRIIATYQLTFISGLSLRAARRAQIESVRVAGDVRGLKIGEAMISDAEMRARAVGCGLMQLTMNKTRTDSARFYERLGFTPSHIGYKRDLT
jgi:GNAT superfamily N-acetyltransferase